VFYTCRSTHRILRPVRGRCVFTLGHHQRTSPSHDLRHETLFRVRRPRRARDRQDLKSTLERKARSVGSTRHARRDRPRSRLQTAPRRRRVLAVELRRVQALDGDPRRGRLSPGEVVGRDFPDSIHVEVEVDEEEAARTTVGTDFLKAARPRATRGRRRRSRRSARRRRTIRRRSRAPAIFGWNTQAPRSFGIIDAPTIAQPTWRFGKCGGGRTRAGRRLSTVPIRRRSPHRSGLSGNIAGTCAKIALGERAAGADEGSRRPRRRRCSPSGPASVMPNIDSTTGEARRTSTGCGTHPRRREDVPLVARDHVADVPADRPEAGGDRGTSPRTTRRSRCRRLNASR